MGIYSITAGQSAYWLQITGFAEFNSEDIFYNSRAISILVTDNWLR